MILNCLKFRKIFSTLNHFLVRSLFIQMYHWITLKVTVNDQVQERESEYKLLESINFCMPF